MPPATSKKSNKTLIVLIILLVLSMALFYYVFFLKDKKVLAPATEGPRFSQQYKLDVLEKLKKDSNTPPITIEQKKRVLKELEDAGSKNDIVTEVAKKKILDSLSN